jgi:hypothetical protein
MLLYRAYILIVFPFSINQMRVALDREDIESFSIWVFIAAFVAGLPFMIVTLATVS